MADVSDAERAIYELNGQPAGMVGLEALARLLLRSESVASSHIEGLELDARQLVRAEAAAREGLPLEDQTAEEVLGNITAMELAVHTIARKKAIDLDDLRALHHALMEQPR